MTGHHLRGLLALAPIVLVAACGSATPATTPAPTPLPLSALRQLYLNAADRYDEAEIPIEQAEYSHCTTGSASAELTACEQALSGDRQTTLVFDNAIRNLNFPSTVRADVAKLLADDAKLETTLEQAATAPSLAVIQSMSNQIFTLLTTTSQDAAQVRSDLGLPAASAPAVTSSPAPSP